DALRVAMDRRTQMKEAPFRLDPFHGGQFLYLESRGNLDHVAMNGLERCRQLQRDLPIVVRDDRQELGPYRTVADATLQPPRRVSGVLKLVLDGKAEAGMHRAVVIQQLGLVELKVAEPTATIGVLQFGRD